MSFPLAPHTIFVTLAGSHAHGTAREGSDVDLRGVCIAPDAVRLSLFETFEQYDGPLEGDLDGLVRRRLEAHPTARHGAGGTIECVVYDVAKFLSLCAASNPNALEILFSDDGDWLHAGPAWRRLHGRRHLFLTRKVEQTFLGYAMSQLKRIQSHRSWLLDPPKAKPTREAFGLPSDGATLSRDDQNRIEQAIAERVRGYGIEDLDLPRPTRIALQERMADFWCDVLAVAEEEREDRTRAVATHALDLPSDVVSALNAEKRYRAAMKHWQSYDSWRSQRNRARAELEAEHGYDTKHAMHLVRLMRMGSEALEDGELRIRRDDAEELAAIRDGALAFDELLALADDLQGRMKHAAESSPLPADADRGTVDELARELIEQARPGVG